MFATRRCSRAAAVLWRGLCFFLPGAVPALLALARGPRHGIAIVAAAATRCCLRVDPGSSARAVPVGVIYAAWVLGPPLLLAWVLRRTRLALDLPAGRACWVAAYAASSCTWRSATDAVLGARRAPARAGDAAARPAVVETHWPMRSRRTSLGLGHGADAAARDVRAVPCALVAVAARLRTRRVRRRVSRSCGSGACSASRRPVLIVVSLLIDHPVAVDLARVAVHRRSHW